MKRTMWRLAAASGVAVCLTLSAGTAGASSSDGWRRPGPGAVQHADQSARTEQNAESKAKSVQFLPINANVPVQFLGFGHNGGDTKQSNDSTAESRAANSAWTGQSVDQDQKVDAPEGHDDRKGDDRKGHDRNGHDDHQGYDKSKGHDDRKGHDRKHDRKGYEPKAGPAFQWADQDAETEQEAHSEAKSKQVLPLNVTLPLQALSKGSNGGDTKQSNDSTAKSSAENEAWTAQKVDQSQSRSGHGWGAPAVQGAEQDAETKQDAYSSAESKQIAPINVNAPIQVLSFGHNGGDTYQSNDSSASSSAENEAWTGQSADQTQHGNGSGPAFQGSEQDAETKQDAYSSAKSEQILPVNVNAPIQILSFGHNGGDTYQSNDSSASSSAENEAGTVQSVDQVQGLGGLFG
jgi:hypothetical protein